MNLQSSVGKAITQAFEISFEEGDCLSRKLAENGIEERYIITHINRSENYINMDLKKIVENGYKNERNIMSDSQKYVEQIHNLIELGEQAIREDYHDTFEPGIITPPYVSGPKYEKWLNNTQIFNDRFLKEHTLYEQIKSICEQRNQMRGQCEELLGMLKAVEEDNYYWDKYEEKNDSKCSVQNSNKVFIVHGHDDAAKYELARTLEKGGFEAIILHEQASAGQTIIEKIESNTDVAFAVVLYTECDLGRDKNCKPEEEQFRARQNVVFEHGYLMAKLTRRNVMALVKGNVETPGDISGIVYTDMDPAGGWKTDLLKNMLAAGLSPKPNMVM